MTVTPRKRTGVSPRVSAKRRAEHGTDAAAAKVAEAEKIVKPAPKERAIEHVALGLQEALIRQEADVYTIRIDGQLDAEGSGFCSRLEQTITGIKWTVQGELARGLNALVRRILLDVLLEPTHKSKDGGIYHLVGYSVHTETGARVAVYRNQDGMLLHCPAKMFDDGRFEKVGK